MSNVSEVNKNLLFRTNYMDMFMKLYFSRFDMMEKLDSMYHINYAIYCDFKRAHSPLTPFTSEVRHFIALNMSIKQFILILTLFELENGSG